MALGAGRARVEDRVNPAVGVVLARKVGDRVEAGQPLCRVHRNAGGEPQPAVAARLQRAYRVGRGPAPEAPLVLERMAEP
jgi:pyrimidine-nucleoside phosphorylase/thymidine phosphorylase